MMSSMEYPEQGRPNIFLYDGECGVCSWAVHFISDRDPTGKISFASLQGDIGKRLCSKYDVPINSETQIPDSMVLIQDGKLYIKSTAALNLMYLFGSFWIILYYLGIFIPRIFRDFVYDIVSENRYRVSERLGEHVCRRPTSDFKKRFIDFDGDHREKDS